MVTRVYEGTWDELSTHADELRSYTKLTLIAPAGEVQAETRYRHDLTPEERIRALDLASAKNRNLPALSEDAFDREILYADDEEPR